MDEVIDYLADLNEAREHTLEEITMLEDAVRREGVTIPGARGNIVSHPALAALVRHRKVLAEIIKVLDPRQESQSDKARRAAKERWARQKRPTERVYVPRAEANGDLV